mgnify:CR=1 FL=1
MSQIYKRGKSLEKLCKRMRIGNMQKNTHNPPVKKIMGKDKIKAQEHRPYLNC